MVEKYENNIYTFYTKHLCNNFHASEICNKFDGNLIHIKSSSVRAFIYQRIENTGEGNYWIGLYQIGDDITKWEWSDGEKPVYTNWRYGEPSSKNEKCVEIRKYTSSPYRAWNDNSCSSSRRFICENSKLLARTLIAF